MKVAVVGLFHLGCVTAACLANANHEVIAYDANTEVILNLQQAKPPIYEPGLQELLTAGLTQAKLHFSHDKADIHDADIVWVTYDTPVDENDQADVNFVLQEIESLFPILKKHALLLISSQLPAGSTQQLLNQCQRLYPDKDIHFAYSPENLRLGKAISVFTHPDRVIIGIQKNTDKARLETLFQPFSTHIIWMSIASAEMTKHALNAFLASSVVFINELAMICEQYGADAREVEKGLKSEERIGAKAYLRPGSAIAGGTLARDVNYLIQLAAKAELPTPFFTALLTSNNAHKAWACRRLKDALMTLENKVITTLGLTYKAGTDTLRRSTAVETCSWLHAQGAKVMAYDPVLSSLPSELGDIISLQPTLEQALANADAVVVTTEWPQFTELTADTLLKYMKVPLVFDASGFLAKSLGEDRRIHYFSVGKQA